METLAIPQFLRVPTPRFEPNTPQKRYQIVTKTPPLDWCLYIQNGRVVLLENERVSNRTDSKVTTREEALELFDAGIPNEIEDSFYKSMLNGHRWGWHQTPFLLCPACDRKAGN